MRAVSSPFFGKEGSKVSVRVLMQCRMLTVEPDDCRSTREYEKIEEDIMSR